MVTSILLVYTSMIILLIALSIMMIRQKIIFIVIILVFVGVCCNLWVVKSNNGKMPVFIKNMSEYTKSDLSVAPRHQAGKVDTKYAFLADFITISKNAQTIYSPGDISMTVGPILLFISILWQAVYTLRHEGLAGFLYNNQPISYPMSMMVIYAVYLGYRHIILYA